MGSQRGPRKTSSHFSPVRLTARSLSPTIIRARAAADPGSTAFATTPWEVSSQVTPSQAGGFDLRRWEKFSAPAANRRAVATNSHQVFPVSTELFILCGYLRFRTHIATRFLGNLCSV